MPGATPPVCKVIDYGKFRYDQTKREKESKKAQHQIKVKELKFKPNINWIAKRLGISPNDANFAVERLESCKFINRIDPKRWVCMAPNNSWFNGSHTNVARRSLQQHLLDKAKVAIDTVKFEERENASLTVAVNKSLLPEIKKRIHKFKDEINELAMSHGKADEVYQACIAFFPLTHQEDK